MDAQVQFFLIMAVIVAGSFGWGHALVSLLERVALRRGETSLLADQTNGPIAFSIGTAAFLGFGGVAVALDVGFFDVLVGFLLIGAVHTARLVYVRVRARPPHRPSLATIAVITSAACVGAIAYSTAIAGPFNPNDDDAAYLYFAKRLLSTGGLIDPFNQRRLAGYDGGTLYQALVLHGSGPSSGLGIEWFLFVLLVVALVAATVRRPLIAPTVLLLGTGLVLLHPVGIWANVAPSFSGAALTLAIMQILARAPDGRPDWRHYVVTGLLLAALVALRTEFAIPAAGAVAANMLRHPSTRRVMQSLGVITATLVISLTGWAVALFRSSRTLLYPLFAGNADPSFVWQNRAAQTISANVARLRVELGTDGIGLEFVGVAVAVILLVTTRNRQKDRSAAATTLVGGWLGLAALLAYETRSLNGATIADIGRYTQPSALALALFAVGLLLENRDGGRGALFNKRLFVVANGAAAVGIFMISVCGTIVAGGGARLSVRQVVAFSLPIDVRSVGDILDGHTGFVDRWKPEHATYSAMSDVIPKGSKILAAVDTPGLLDFSRFSFATLDLVGAVSPPPHIPISSGEKAVVSYLRGLGYTGIVASRTESPGLFNYAQWKASTTSGIYIYRVIARDFILWSKILSQLTHDPSLKRTRVGSLVYVAFPH